VEDLSGGELQRFAIGVVVVQEAQIYMFDEPSSYLDVKQRLNAARCIRSLLTNKTYVICVEHDLSVRAARRRGGRRHAVVAASSLRERVE
jgi:ATP-binding cassette subfamily E protein 1